MSCEMKRATVFEEFGFERVHLCVPAIVIE